MSLAEMTVWDALAALWLVALVLTVGRRWTGQRR